MCDQALNAGIARLQLCVCFFWKLLTQNIARRPQGSAPSHPPSPAWITLYFSQVTALICGWLVIRLRQPLSCEKGIIGTRIAMHTVSGSGGRVFMSVVVRLATLQLPAALFPSEARFFPLSAAAADILTHARLIFRPPRFFFVNTVRLRNWVRQNKLADVSYLLPLRLHGWPLLLPSRQASIYHELRSLPRVPSLPFPSVLVPATTVPHRIIRFRLFFQQNYLCWLVVAVACGHHAAWAQCCVLFFHLAESPFGHCRISCMP